MTAIHDLDRQLGAWFEERATLTPPDGLLERSLARVAAARQRPGWLIANSGIQPRQLKRHSVGLLAAAALIAALLIGAAIAVGSGLIRLPSVVPPLPDAPFSTMPAPTSTAPVTSSSPVPSPSPTGPLGGGVIVTHDWEGVFDHGPYEVYALDAGTGAQTLLGTLPGGRAASPYVFQRDSQERHVLILGSDNQRPISSLESPTDASRTLGFIASRDVAWISDRADSANLNGSYGEGYVLSPSGDRIAAVHVDGSDRPTELVVLDVGGSGVQKIPIPAGVTASVRSWSPDGSAILATGCRPCNKAVSPSEKQTADHSHLYIVPLDGSPWRELLDVDNAYLDATWSPDGSTLAVLHGACIAGAHMPRCPPGYSTLSLLNLQDETERQIATPTETAEWPAWSPDGRRIAFVGGKAGEILEDGGIFVVNADGSGVVKLAETSSSRPPIWSPDGRWLLYQNDWQTNGWWIVSSDGGTARRLGAFGGVAW
jgi:Tol biopolymer transport system component